MRSGADQGAPALNDEFPRDYGPRPGNLLLRVVDER